ncbi:MAG: DUF1127 domain-containing protein [Dongiaceae bacterium]
MTRFTNNEKVIVGLAKTQASIAGSTQIDSVDGALKALFALASRPFRRGAIARSLRQLDDRMLADIGLRRWQINSVADLAVSGTTMTVGAAVRVLFAALFGSFAAWRHRRAAYWELMALDDRMLHDIGLSRGDIPAVIAGIGRHEVLEDLAGLNGLRAWNRSRDVSKALHALDNRMLDDIGMVRGDIEIVAEALALRSLSPANRNGRAPRAA